MARFLLPTRESYASCTPKASSRTARPNSQSSQKLPYGQTFFVSKKVKARFVLDGIITLVDAKHVERHLDEQKPEGAENEAVEQLAFADRVLLNKVDLVTEDDIVRVEERIRSINRFAPIQRCEQSAVSVDSVLDIKGFDLKRTLEMDPEFLNTDADHVHDQTVSSLSIVLPGELDLDEVQKWMQVMHCSTQIIQNS